MFMRVSGGTMRAWVFDGDRKMHVDIRPIPTPGPFDVRVQVARAGICGSDIHGYAGESGFRLPGVVMGHEASGIVDAVGSAVEGVQSGDRVTFAPTLPCDGSCGHTTPNRCERLRIIGVAPDAPGAFADFVLVPAQRLFQLGDVSLELGSMVEPLAVGLHAARQASVQPGDRVLVLGGGMIGQSAAIAARLEGAGSVTVSDPVAARRRIAAALGFHSLEPGELEGDDPYDCAIDAVGIPATLTTAINSIRRGRRVSLVGLGLPKAEITMFDLVGRERMLVGSAAYTDADFAEMLEAVADEKVDLSPLSRRTVGFDEVANSLAALAGGSEPAVKVTMSTEI
jgi:2-desacetyl-2-hydroxyethyl bacteriochlorophyllide A dehydrogenase